MKKLIIEWRHLDVKGETCNRCYDTGENLNQEVKRLNRILQPKGFEVEWVEVKLDDSQVAQSNMLLFNGVPIEEILEIRIEENFCDSCSDLLGTETYCRTIRFEGEEYEDIPAKAIRKTAYKVLGLEGTNLFSVKQKKNTSCGDNTNGCC